MKLLAYHGDQKIKDKYVDRVEMHAAADEIAQGKYVRPLPNGKFQYCAIGCALEDPKGGHEKYPIELGIPLVLARIEESIFESLPIDRAKLWPAQFLKAIKPGADLSGVWRAFAIYLLVDPTVGVIQYARPNGKIAIQKVADLYSENCIDIETWKKARADAADAAAAAYAYAAAAAAEAAYAADAYAYAAAEAAAAAAAYAADAAYAAADAYAAAYAADAADAAASAYAAAYAADAYAAAAAYAAAYAADARRSARGAARVKQADKLLQLLEAAPMGEQSE